MSVWRRLLGGGAGAQGPGRTSVQAIFLEDGSDDVAVVGESNYQGAIRGACGAARGEAVSHDCLATLIAEPDNEFDRNAVMVYLEGSSKVGYLSRDDALDYGPAVQAAADGGHAIACDAHISGRGRGGATTNLGVFLKLPSPEEAEELVLAELA